MSLSLCSAGRTGFFDKTGTTCQRDRPFHFASYFAGNSLRHSERKTDLRSGLLTLIFRNRSPVLKSFLVGCSVFASLGFSPAAPVAYALTEGESNRLPPPIAANAPRQSIDPNTLVLSAVQQAVLGPPFSCKVYQQSHSFGQQVILSGEYKAAGNGTGQFRYTARVSAGQTTIDSIQVSDGRLMYTQIGKQPPRIVNIDKVRETLAPHFHLIQERPDLTLHLAIGGHPELLRNLYQRYNWHAVAAGKSGETEVWQLLGSLRTEHPKITATAPIDRINLAVQPLDEGLPTGVRLTLGRSQAFPYFPYSIEYFRVKKDKDGRAVDHIAVSKIDYSEPTLHVTFQESDFSNRPDTNADTTVWETDLYIPAQ